MTLEEIDERYHDAALDEDGEGWDQDGDGPNRELGWDDPGELSETEDALDSEGS